MADAAAPDTAPSPGPVSTWLSAQGFDHDLLPADHLGVEQVMPLCVVAGELGSRLAHQHAGHQWHARKVPADPELVGRNVLVSHTETA